MTALQEQRLGELMPLSVPELETALQSVDDLPLLQEMHHRAQIRTMHKKAALLRARITALRKAGAQ